MAGERIGYIAVNPRIENVDKVINGLTLSNRILGFVNAPVIGQRIVEQSLAAIVDVNIYKKRRDAMAEILDQHDIEYLNLR